MMPDLPALPANITVRGARDRNRVRQMLAQLGKPLSRPEPLDLDELTELSGPLEPLRRVVEIACESFQPRYPVDEMVRYLRHVGQVVREESLDRYPEGRELLDRANTWLQRIERIDPLNSRACLKIQLAPSLSVDEIEEDRTADASGRYIRLPVAIINDGPGPALNINIRLLPLDAETVSVDGPSVINIDMLDCDEIRVVTFRFCQKRDEEVSVGVLVTYYDFTCQDEKSKNEDETFKWPPLTAKIKGPIRNPFVIGRPVGSKSELGTLFRNRDDQLRKLGKSLGVDVSEIVGTNNEKHIEPQPASPFGPDLVCSEANSNQGSFVFVKGLRRTGKTSLILQLREEITKQKFLLVYVDCRDCEQQAALIESSTNQSWNQRDFLREVASVVAASADVPLPRESDVGEREELKGFLRSVQNQRQCRLVLVFDDADNFGTGEFAQFAESILAFFNYLTVEGVFFIFVHELTDGFWGNVEVAYDPVRVDLLKYEATVALATEVLPTDLRYTPLALRYLWLLTGGYPFLTQLVCHQMIEELNQQRNPETNEVNGIVEIGTLKRVVDHIILSEDYRPQIDYLSLGFDLEERSLLLQLARSSDVDTHTGRVMPVKTVARNGVGILIRDRDEFGSDEVHAHFLKQYGTEKMLEAFRRLLEKEVFDRSNDGISVLNQSPSLRLRVGFLWLYLHKLQTAE